MRYKSKPTIIEAEQYIIGRQTIGVGIDSDGPYVITIHNQKTKIESGDYIIREPDGIHFYPCKPEIFKSKYEPIE